VRTCVSNRDADPPIQKLLHTVGILCIDYYEACQRKNRANSWNDCHSPHSRVEVSRQQAQKKICWDFVHALLALVALAVWLQAGEDRAIAAGSKADLKSGCRPLLLGHYWRSCTAGHGGGAKGERLRRRARGDWLRAGAFGCTAAAAIPSTADVAALAALSSASPEVEVAQQQWLRLNSVGCGLHARR
jgi:hypothetical protein